MTRFEILHRAFTWTLHSCLFAVAPIVVLLTANMHLFPVAPSDAVRGMLWLIAANLVLLMFLSRWRGIRAAAVTLSWFYISLSFYGLGTMVVMAFGRPVPAWLWPAGYVLLSALTATWAGRIPHAPDRRYRSLNAAAVALLGACLLMAAVGHAPGANNRWHHAVASLANAAPTPSRALQPAPDIFYIVLDGMGRPDVLQRAYGLDASDELAALERLGWTISRRSQANYPQTYLSIASALNGVYLDELAGVMEASRDRRPLYELIQQSGSIAGLKRIGYEFTLIGSNTSVTRTHRAADACVCQWPGLTEFENGLLSMTPFAALPLYRLTYGAHYRTVLGGLDALDRVPESDAPQLVLAHIMLPHPPFVLDRDGRAIVATGPVVFHDADHFRGTTEDYRAGYREQAAFVLRRLKKFADNVARRKRRTMVVVHGDHGPGAGYSHYALDRGDVSERFPIFMAIHLGDSRKVPDDLSPVNVIRFLFNAGFGTGYRLLPNRSYYASWDEPYGFNEVRVR